MEESDIATLSALPSPRSSRLIDFEHAEVRPGIAKDTFFLIVSGTRPWITMTVELVPLIYIALPEYWGIEVIGTQSGIGLPTTGPYTAVLDISRVRGSRGIEVIGAYETKQLDL